MQIQTGILEKAEEIQNYNNKLTTVQPAQGHMKQGVKLGRRWEGFARLMFPIFTLNSTIMCKYIMVLFNHV